MSNPEPPSYPGPGGENPYGAPQQPNPYQPQQHPYGQPEQPQQHPYGQPEQPPQQPPQPPLWWPNATASGPFADNAAMRTTLYMRQPPLLFQLGGPLRSLRRSAGR